MEQVIAMHNEVNGSIFDPFFDSTYILKKTKEKVKKLLTKMNWCGIFIYVDTARWSSGQDVSLSR